MASSEDFTWGLASAPVSNASGNGTTDTPGLFHDIELNVDFVKLLMALAMAVLWISYLTFYHSRLLGFIASRFASHLVSDGHLSFGSFSFSFLSGKAMVRDFLWANRDFSIRIQDGWVVFRFWKSFIPKQRGEDFSHSPPRVLIQFNGVEIHVYNRSRKYQQLCQLFGQDLFEFSNDSHTTGMESSQAGTTWIWKDLLSSVKTTIASGRVIFGNHLVSSSLVISFDNLDCLYTIKPPTSLMDEALLSLKGNCENFRMSLVKSPNFSGPYEPPPRIMGEGFVIVQTSQLDFYYFRDECGVVPPQSTQSFTENCPCHGIDFKAGKGTVISYGPWVDRERDSLYKFFWPNDYQKLMITQCPTEGQRRVYSSFEVNFSTLADSTLDVLFSKNDVTNAVHINFLKGSYVEISIPWTVGVNGYTSVIKGQLLNVESSTSLEYRSLLQCETLEFCCDINYPRSWNDLQNWKFGFTFSKATGWLVFMHKRFIQDLLNDWSSRTPPDLFHFIPYACSFGFVFKEFEVILPANDHNWIDTSSKNEKNSCLSINGECLGLNFTLPFADFQPETVDILCQFQGENLEMCLFLPVLFVCRDAFLSLVGESNIFSSDFSTSEAQTNFLRRKQWHDVTAPSNGWIPFWKTPRGELNLLFNYHLNPISHKSEFPDVNMADHTYSFESFSPSELMSDHISVDLELGPSFLHVTGVIFRLLLNVKENYLGESQEFSNLDSFNYCEVLPISGFVNKSNFNPFDFRPLSVTMSIKLNQISALCLLFEEDLVDPPCEPMVFIETLAFEMKKQFDQTRLQLFLSPAILRCVDKKLRYTGNENLHDGQIILSSLQLRGNALFSDKDLPLDSVTVEYAWLLELTLGKLFGRFTTSHLIQTAKFLEIFASFALSEEEAYACPKSIQLCQHMVPVELCPKSALTTSCPSESQLKYKMLRLSLDQMDIYLVESDCSLRLQVEPVRLAQCSLHTDNTDGGLTVRLGGCSLTQFLATGDSMLTGKTSKRPWTKERLEEPPLWLECGHMQIEEMTINLTTPCVDSFFGDLQRQFLLAHDRKMTRLWFLWEKSFKCGCIGGCQFFLSERPHSSRDWFDTTRSFAVSANSVVDDCEDLCFGESILRSREPIILSKFDPVFGQQTYVKSNLCEMVDTIDSTVGEEIFYETHEEIPLDDRNSQIPLIADRADSVSSAESFISSSSMAADFGTINLYGQLNRSVMTSPMLMVSYRRLLNGYVCSSWNVLPKLPKFAMGQMKPIETEMSATLFPFSTDFLPSFDLIRSGLNSLELIKTTSSHEGSASTSSQQPLKSDPPKLKCDETKVDTKHSILVKLSRRLKVFVCPLGIEVLRTFVAACLPDVSVTHPSLLLQRLFDRCSRDHHPYSLLEKSKQAGFKPFQFHMNLAGIDCQIFQCGVVEKIVRFDELKKFESLTPCCVLILSIGDTLIDGKFTRPHENEKSSGKEIDLTTSSQAFGGATTHQIYFQLIQIADKNNGNIGILKKKDSKIPMTNNWSSLSLSREFKDCLIMEGGLDQIVFSLRRNGSHNDPLPGLMESTRKNSRPFNDIGSGETDWKPPHASVVEEKKIGDQKNRTVGSLFLGHYFVTIGLLETWPPATLKIWPLYDIFFPSISAWLHVVHRFKREVSAMMKESQQWTEQTLVFLLTEAFDNPQNLPINPVKSEKFDEAKLYRRQLQCCPSCLLLLILQSFCQQKAVVEDSFKRQRIRTIAFNNLIKEGLVALLSQWQERFSADKILILPKRRSLLQTCQIDISTEKRGNERPKVSSAFSDADDSSSDASDEAGETMALISKDNSASLQNLVQKLQSFSDSDKLETPRDSSLHRTCVNDFARQTNSTEAESSLVAQSQRGPMSTGDLYSWMANEQKTMRRSKTGADLHDDSGLDVNPLHVPLGIYFGSLFNFLDLEESSNAQLAIFNHLGSKVLFSATLDSLSICIVEPKVLRVAETTVKVAHMEKPFLVLQNISLAADFSLKNSLKVDRKASGRKCHALSISYHAHLASAELGVGFSTIFFLSQVAYVVRAFMDTYIELKEAVDSKTDRKSTLNHRMDFHMNLSETKTHKSPVLPADGRLRISDMQRNESSSQAYEWSARMLDILAFYQRQQKREGFQRLPISDSVEKTLLTACEENVFAEIVFGVIDLQLIRVQMQMTELIIFSAVSNVQFGHSSRRKFGVVSKRLLLLEVSLTSSIQKMTFNLSESQMLQSRPEISVPHMQTVVDMTVGQSQILLTRLLKRGEMKESLLVEVGPVTIDIPLHPGSLHGVVLRGTKNISDTLKELKTPQTVEEIVSWKQQNKETSMGRYSRQFQKSRGLAAIHFGVVLRSLNISANLLPSLKALYSVSQSTASGVTGKDCKFSFEVPKHRVTFDVKELAIGSDSSKVTPNIQLSFPPITAQGAVVQASASHGDTPKVNDGQQGYLKVDVEVGVVQHTLTTDLLNQILFIQEAFLRELNEILQKITADRHPTYAWLDSSEQRQPLFYSLEVILKNIQITATTPSSSAIRLETDLVKFQLSNCVEHSGGNHEKVFGMAEMNLSLILGQLVKPVMYEEVEPELQQFAYFKTQIGFRNAPNTAAHPTDQKIAQEGRAYLVTLNRPVVFILPSAVDKALRLWLNYKNTYEFWNEQRQQIRARNPSRYSYYSAVEKSVFEHFGSPNYSTSGHLFFQVTIPNSLVLCIPLYSAHYYGIRSVEDSNCALILSLAETRISVCSSGCFVSDGCFRNFCVKFVDDFDAASSDWQMDLDIRNSDQNGGFVPEGTYQICSKTTAPKDELSPAEWLLNIQWQMKGIDINLNSQIAKMSSLLVSTLTSLTTDEDDRISAQPDKNTSVSSATAAASECQMQQTTGVSFMVGEESAHQANKTQLERSMNEQSKVVCELVNSGAKEDAVEMERRKLQDLESQYFRQFRREMFEKLKDQSRKATSLKDRLGVTYHRTPNTSGSFKVSANGHKRSESLAIQTSILTSRRFSEAEPTRHGHVRTLSYEERMPTPIEESIDENQDGLRCGDAHNISPFTHKILGQASFVSPEIEVYPDELISPTTPCPSSFVFSQPLKVETSCLRNESPSWERCATPAPPVLSQTSAIDLYLDIKVDIESGKCHFRTNSKETKEEGLQSKFKSSERLADLKARRAVSAMLKDPRGSTETEVAVPGLSVQCHYASHSGTEGGGFNVNMMRKIGRSEDPINQASCSGNKKGQFYMKMILKSMPKETVIKPHMLDFLEETLAPLSEVQNFSLSTHSVKEQGANVSPQASAPATTDSLIMETTGSFPVDVVLCFVVEPTDLRFTSEPISRVECLLRLPTLELAVTSRKSGDLFMESIRPKTLGGTGLRSTASMPAFKLQPDQQKGVDEMLSGGISVTASLSQFSLYIFHPYGTIVDKSGSEKVECRKDSLSLQVKSVTVNIARSRNLVTLDVTEAGGLGTANSVKNSVRFSLIVDISEAFFKYDMRRLQEILSFPKAWYRRAIFRRLFLGDETSVVIPTKRPTVPSVNVPSNSHTSLLTGTDAEESAISGSVSSDGDSLQLKIAKTLTCQPKKQPDQMRRNTCWDAVVVWAFNFSHLDIETNMGNTMGITKWITRTAGSQGHAVVDSRGSKNVLMTFQLGSSKLESKSGIVGGLIDISDLLISALLKEAEGKVPIHEVVARLSSEIRVEWMGSSVLIGSITNFKGSVKDIWSLGTPVLNRLTCNSTVETATLRLEGKLEWDKLELMLTQSTVSDLIKMHSRLTKFFENEFRSGKRLFVKDSIETNGSAAADTSDHMEPLNLYRHWQDSLELFSGLLMDLKTWPIPRSGVILYGELELIGQDFQLACFYGTNLRAPKWAVFHVAIPIVCFSSQSQDVVLPGQILGAFVEQTMEMSVGKSVYKQTGVSVSHADSIAASVCSVVSRGYVPTQLSSIQEWFDYTFRAVLTDVYGEPIGSERSRQKDYRPVVTKLLLLPSLNVTMKTLQKQPASLTDHLEDGERQAVEFDFISDFDGIVRCSQDFASLYFLHELVSSYLQTLKTEKKPDRDARVFKERNWLLKPNIRLIQFQNSDTVGLDWLTERIGLTQRLTIPKWIQRGFMDQLDSLLARITEADLKFSKKGKI